jgi:dimethylhistidine N-methyltransferase
MSDRTSRGYAGESATDALHDLEPDTEQFLEETLAGLRQDPKVIPCKYLYDERGSRLFDAICELHEYYPTRTEIMIMEEHGADMAERLGSGCLLIEYGSGSSTKTPILLRYLKQSAGYVPVEIAREHLLQSADRLKSDFPHLKILPVCADYTRPLNLPEIDREVTRRVVYYPGSTIGNFHPDDAVDFLRGIAEVCGEGGGLLLGVDLQKKQETLEAAYNDGARVTAEFNLNVLHRINRELGADFDVDQFEHHAIYRDDPPRIEMHLFSQSEQTVTIDGEKFTFAEGESIHTESSFKYTYDGFAELAEAAGFTVEMVWTDPEQLFSVQYLTVA